MSLIEFKNLPDTSTAINAENLNNNFNSIVESGSNENGCYTKFIDGTMICSNRIYNSNDTEEECGTFYISSEKIALPNFPTEFKNQPKVIFQYETATWSSSVIIGIATHGYPTETSPGLVRLISPVYSIHNGGYIDYIAIGRWK